jgi:hypothetical protein
MTKVATIAILTVVVIAVAAFVLVSYPNILSKVTASSTPTASVPIAMTDPAEVPANTTSLFISYSSFKVIYSNGNGSGSTVSVNASGSIDLLSLVNISKVLTVASLPAGASVRAVQFTVVSANATINGTEYNVNVPSPLVTATVPVKFGKINSSSSIVLDFTPALITVYASNSTQYMLVPSLLALSSAGIVNKTVGAIAHISAGINRTIFAARPNITITSAKLQQVGNLTEISVTVKDNSNESVILQHLRLKMLNGFKLSSLNFSQNILNGSKFALKKYILDRNNFISNITKQLPSFIGRLNSSIYSNLSSINSSISGGINIIRGRISHHNAVNSSFFKFGNLGSSMQQRFTTVQQQIKQNIAANENRLNIMNKIMTGMSINLFIASNGSMFLPFSKFKLFNLPFNVSDAKVNRINSTDMNITYGQAGFSSDILNNSSFSLPFNFGYDLSAGSSVTLNFSGEINLGDGLVSLQLIPGSQYDLYLQGTNGANSVYTVNATS